MKQLDQPGGVQTCCAAGLGQCEKERKPLLWEGSTCIRKIMGVFSSSTRAAVDLRVPERRLNPKCL